MSEIKPLLRQMIDNNKPHWRPETIRGAHNQLDDYEAKAKAFDAILESYEESLSEGHMADDVCNIIEKYNEQEESE